ncbi:LCP family protein [Radiobacillus deserti]|uniref:LytR family transcriptional regulator n=1 Tax=Radiobacillus deserti TaxID=2594883 RepID=A0A516KBM6_9BACI|nr:LCP family protein [Radiobacillus deserti]QDP38794.1 LytR family transcriptional regulator [Radiobacillus deserti]
MEQNKRTKVRKQQKKRKLKKAILLTFLFTLILVLAFGGYIFYQAYDAAKDSHKELDRKGNKSELREKAVTIGKDPISILLLGIENYSTDGKDGRADTQIVVTLNPDSNQMTMTSVPRDTMIELTEEEVTSKYAGTNKILASYAFGSITGYGGNKLAVEKVEELLDVPIDHYIAVDFEGFRDIVDALGGVTIDIKEPFWEKDIYNNNQPINFAKGEAHLNGTEALAFVRMRKRDVNAIYPRDERQRQFISAAIDEAVSAGTIFKIGEITDILGENVQTSLEPSEIYALQKAYSSMSSSKIQTIEIPGQNQRINDLYYFIPDEVGLKETSIKIKQALDLPVSEPGTESDATTETE